MMNKTKEEIVTSMLDEGLIDSSVAEEMLSDESLTADTVLYRKQLLMLVRQGIKEYEEGNYESVDDFFKHLDDKGEDAK